METPFFWIAFCFSMHLLMCSRYFWFITEGQRDGFGELCCTEFCLLGNLFLLLIIRSFNGSGHASPTCLSMLFSSKYNSFFAFATEKLIFSFSVHLYVELLSLYLRHWFLCLQVSYHDSYVNAYVFVLANIQRVTQFLLVFQMAFLDTVIDLILHYYVAVVVSPHGVRGSLTGCSSSDLVKQSYFRSF